jgi:CDGSH-type Zn-finger protein
MSGTPEIGGTKPIRVATEADKSYWWCACGKSKAQPFCDGSHKGSEFSPLEYKAQASGETVFCTCKRTGSRPTCDGSHKKLATT